jgi:hypothetical protein
LGNGLLKILADHEWVELRARDEACPFLQDLWANSKLQILESDAIDFPDRSQLRNNDVNLLVAALMHNTSLTSLTTSWDWQVSKRKFLNALAAIGAQGFTSLQHLCLVYTKGPYTEMLNILGGLFPNLENISLPDWWPGVAGLTGRCLESWPMSKTLAVGTVQPAAAILTEIESGRGTCTLMQGMLFADCTNPRTYSRSGPHVRSCLSLIQHIRVETLVLNGVIMGKDFKWVQTALELFPSLKMLEAVVLFPGVEAREVLRRGLEIRLLSEIEDRIALKNVLQGATPFCELCEALDDSWKVNVVVDWPGKVRVDSVYITLEKR